MSKEEIKEIERLYQEKLQKLQELEKLDNHPLADHESLAKQKAITKLALKDYGCWLLSLQNKERIN